MAADDCWVVILQEDEESPRNIKAATKKNAIKIATDLAATDVVIAVYPNSWVSQGASHLYLVLYDNPDGESLDALIYADSPLDAMMYWRSWDSVAELHDYQFHPKDLVRVLQVPTTSKSAGMLLWYDPSGVEEVGKFPPF